MEIENEVTISMYNGSQVGRQHNLRNNKVITKAGERYHTETIYKFN